MASSAFAEAPGERPFWPRRKWWLALLVILLLAGALRYPGYDFGLPFVEHVGLRADEAYYSLATQMILDQGSAKGLHLHNYPPGILAVNYIALRYFHDPTEPPTTVLGGLRLLSILVGLATVVVVALLGYSSAGSLAGLISAGLWAFSPVMVEFSRYATADIYLVLFSLLSLWLTLAGTAHQRWGYTTAGTYALMLAIVFKYPAVVITPLVLFAPLIQGRASWRHVLGNCGRFALFLAWLFLLTPALEAFGTRSEDFQVSNAWVQAVQLNRLPGLVEFREILREILSALDLRLFLPGWLGLIFLFRFRKRSCAWKRFATLVIVAGILLWLFTLALFDGPYIRFMLPAVSFLIALAGVGYAFWWHYLQRRIAHFARPRRRLVAAASLVMLLALNLPNAWTALNDTWQLTLPDQRNDLAVWADGSLPASKYITNYSNHRTLNSSWGGYAGETRFEYAGNPFSDTTIAEWRAQDVLFAIVPHFQYGLWREDGVHEFATQTTLLKSYSPSDAYRGPAMVVLLL